MHTHTHAWPQIESCGIFWGDGNLNMCVMHGMHT